MRLFNKNILLVLALLAVAQGCEKEPAGPKDTGVPIMLNATESGTKALLENGTFSATNNQIKIYDYYTPISGPADYYIGVTPDEYIKSDGPDQGTWPFVNQRYSWTPDGVHKFFGWLAEDVNIASTDDEKNTLEEFFGSDFSFNTSTQILSIPAKAMLDETPQFDFMYSDIYERNLTTDPDYVTAVPLNFSHLFTAFNITAENKSKNTIELKSVTLSNLKDKKSATINYAASKGATGSTDATVSYSSGSTSSDSFIFNVTEGGNWTNQPVVVADYHLLWPQTAEDLDAATVTVVYDYTEGNVTTRNLSKVIPLSSIAAWNPGQKNNLNLVFKDKEIILKCVVQPWTWNQQEIEFSDQVTIPEGGTMLNKWQNVASVNYDTGEVILKQSTSQVASVKFTIDTPRGATWTASLIMIEGATDAVQFVDGYRYGKVGEEGEIRLKISKDTPIENRNSYYLVITVQTADGNTIVVNEGLTGGSYSHFKIIQNLIN